MEIIFEFLRKRGYSNISQNYYSYINKWIDIWKGKAEWLNIQTIKNIQCTLEEWGREFAKILQVQ